MSTRAGIIVTDGTHTAHFYRHSDGYPEGAMPSLERFLKLIIDGKIRSNVSQGAPWLLAIGADEYKDHCKTLTQLEDSEKSASSWKFGSIELTTCVYDHGDLEYIYDVNMKTKEIKHRKLSQE